MLSANLKQCTVPIAVLVGVYFLCLSFASKAQTSVTGLPNVIPASPAAGALGKYGEIEVSKYTGVPSIVQPLTQIGDGSLKLAVNLTYHASGIRVMDEGGLVGLGWSLDAGGAITRTVKGLPDELPNGFWGQARRGQFVQNNLYVQRGTPIGLTQFEEVKKFASGYYDCEPDEFAFNFHGRTGKLLFDEFGNARTNPVSDLDIKPITAGLGLVGFTITDSNGIIYQFNAAEHTERLSDGLDPAVGDITFNSAWYITSIRSPHKEEIRFHYRSLPGRLAPFATGATVFQQMETSGNMTGMPRPSTDFSRQDVEYHGLVLDSITSVATTVRFYVSARLDDSELYLLDSLIISNKLGGFVDRWKLQYRYSGGTTNRISPFASQTVANFSIERPLLTRLTRGTEPAYKFSYSPLPPVNNRLSAIYRQDHWGYYNNGYGSQAPLNPTLIPELSGTYQPANAPSYAYFFPGGNRSPSEPDVLAYTLRRIEYPTGGHTDYDFESNKYGYGYNPATGRYIPITDTVKSAHRVIVAASGTGSNRQGAFEIDSIDIQFRQRVQVRGTLSGDDGGSAMTFIDINTTRYNYDNAGSAGNTTVWNYQANPSGAASTVETYVVLQPGRYYLIASALWAHPGGTASSLRINYSKILAINKWALASGLRIKEIRSYDGLKAQCVLRKKYTYQVASEPDRSSGVLVAPVPSYTHLFTAQQQPGVYAVYLTATSGPSSFISTTAGSVVGHQCVTVTSDSLGQEGREEFYYQSPASFALPVITRTLTFPFPPAELPDDRLGLLLKHNVYKGAGNDTVLVQQAICRYQTHSRQGSSVVGVKYGYSKIKADAGQVVPPRSVFDAALSDYNNTVFTARHYIKRVSWTYRHYERTSKLDPATGAFNSEELTTKLDERTLLPRVVTRKSSNNQWLITKNYYAANYDTTAINGVPSAALQGLRTLQRRYILAAPIETQQWISNGADTTLLKASTVQYAGIRPCKTFELPLAAPLPKVQFAPVSIQNNALTQDARYQERVLFEVYDGKSHVLQARQSGGVPRAGIWGYQGSQLLAEVLHASYTQVACTSFEPRSTGRWLYDSSSTSPHRILGGRTGGYAYRITTGNDVQLAKPLPAGVYELTFWAQGGYPGVVLNSNVVAVAPTSIATAVGWMQYRLRLTATANSTLRLVLQNSQPVVLDELRLYPVGAAMTSYTHDPLVGITSQTDPSGRTTTYEYDPLGRLLRIRDEQGRILTQQEYRFARP